jgi:hypothetical protein
MWLKILSSEGDSARFSWGNADGPFPQTYTVGLRSIERATKTVRKQLARLSDWGATKDFSILRPILVDLARAGYELHFTLFDAFKPTEREVAQSVLSWVREQEGADDRSLCITADAQIHVPWGLVCDIDPISVASSDYSSAEFPNFWGLKYALAATFSGYGHSKRKLVRPKVRLLSLMDRSLCEGHQREFEQLRMRSPIGTAYSIEYCCELLDNAGPGDTIFHFFGHHKNGELDLGGGETINLIRFKLLMDRLTERSGGSSMSCGLVMLSACEGAVGDSDYSLIAAADRPGLCGLIATESVVPSDFAAIFSSEFLPAVLDGIGSVGQVMYRLRHDESMWPLSLLYGCYAQPEYRVSAPAGIGNLASV